MSFISIHASDLREWLFRSQTGVGVGVRNSSGVGSGVGTGVGANNISGVDSGVDFLVSFCIILNCLHTPRAFPIKGVHGNV